MKTDPDQFDTSELHEQLSEKTKKKVPDKLALENPNSNIDKFVFLNCKMNSLKLSPLIVGRKMMK